VTELLPESQKSLLMIRAPLSEDGSVSIYFSSQDGRPMSLSEWAHLKQFIEMISEMCVRQEEKVRAADA
jgi:hypothetical protein